MSCHELFHCFEMGLLFKPGQRMHDHNCATMIERNNCRFLHQLAYTLWPYLLPPLIRRIPCR
eukprot:810238-Rhodomonas_salina.1